jgi:putative RNA 2'-phosphotransferase
LFLATEIPPEFISGPLVSKEVLEGRKRKGPPKEKPFREALFQAPGTFVLDAERDPALYRGGKGRKRKGWKEEARKMRKDKRGRTNKTVS